MDMLLEARHICNLLSRNASGHGISSKAFSDQWELLWRDLRSKSKSLPAYEQRELLVEGLFNRLVAEGLCDARVAADFALFSSSLNRIRLDALIFTILEIEWNACRVAFADCAELKDCISLPFSQLAIFELVLESGEIRRIGVTLVGNSNNVECAVFCDRIFQFVAPSIAVLSGICAVRKDKLKLGTVVGSRVVYHIDRGTKLDDSVLESFRPLSLTDTVNGVLSGFQPARLNWLKNYRQFVCGLEKTGARILKSSLECIPKFEIGIVLAGEYVRRDDVLIKFANAGHNGVLAIEMEGAGFAAACQSNKIDWIVFRGGSDFGDRRKRDSMQSIAALNAALAARAFLLSFFVKHSVPQSYGEAPVF